MLKITDTHVHFWNPGLLNYGWLDDLPAINRPFMPGDFPSGDGSWTVEKMVFVQAGGAPQQGVQEAKWVSGLAAHDPRIQGIVAFAPLEDAAVQTTLDHLCEMPLVKSIRRLIQSETPGFCAQPAFIKNVQSLPNYNLIFDICIKHHQLAEVIELVRACPDTQFVLDHIGKPDIKNGILDPWRDHIQTLARFPNVWCKISGLVTEADWTNWTPGDLRPYVDTVIGAFGIQRVMYGGDWPVVRLAGQYETWVAALLSLVSNLTESEKHLLFEANGVTFYGLK